MSDRAVHRVVELAAASLPWAIRDRYREEWLHDLEHAAEANVRAGDVAWGAVRTAITADRMQAPTLAHALLQARLRIDAAGVHVSVAIMLGIFAWQSWLVDSPLIALTLAIAAIAHVVMQLVQLHLAALTLGGRLFVAGPLFALGVLAAGVGMVAGAGANGAIGAGGMLATALAWLWLPAVACLLAGLLIAESGKLPKPDLHEQIRPDLRRPLLRITWGIVALTFALCLLETLVSAPLHHAPGASLVEAWQVLMTAGSPSPMLAAATVLAITLAPLALAVVGASRWARSERGMLGWAAGGALLAVAGTFFYCTFIEATAALLPLLAGVLVHFTVRANASLAPLPPASVPLPPGPWHMDLDIATVSAGGDRSQRTA